MDRPSLSMSRRAALAVAVIVALTVPLDAPRARAAADLPSGPLLSAPAGAVESVVACVTTDHCAGLDGSPGAGTWRFAFDAPSAGTFRVRFRRLDAGATSWTSGNSPAVTLSTPTGGVSVTGDRVTTDAARTVTVTVAPDASSLLDGMFWVEVEGIASDTSGAAATTRTTRSPLVGVFVTVGTNTVEFPGGASVTHLVLGGGGQGGSRTNDLTSVTWAGGGGAGGLLLGTDVPFTAGTYDVTVGAGGSGGTDPKLRGTQGGDSRFGPLVAQGGGGGAASSSGAGTVQRSGADGGSGGGGAHDGGAGTGGAGVAGQGSAGGAGFQPEGGSGGGAGGGGAGGVGGAATLAGGGDGGPGVQNSITGTPVHYAGGGGGGPGTTGGQVSGSGGLGGGGASGANALASSGGGGGAGRRTGGSGLVVLRVRPDAPSGAFVAAIGDTAPSVDGGGALEVGARLIAPAVTWTDAPDELRWNWQACTDTVNVPASCIETVTASDSLIVTGALVGRSVRVQASATNPGGTTTLNSVFTAAAVPAVVSSGGVPDDAGLDVTATPDEDTVGPVPTAIPAGGGGARPSGALMVPLSVLLGLGASVLATRPAGSRRRVLA